MFHKDNTAILITDPQVEFLKPAGKGFGAKNFKMKLATHPIC